MRSLSKPPHQKPKPNNENNKNKEAKPSSKKIVKTVFQSPFRYKM